ncbi:hypothetical protein BH23DEI1_BH23DEI1_24720 [soil metagenome]
MSLVLHATLALATSALLFGAAWAQPLTSLPIDEVLAGPINLHDVTATSATLEVTTSIDLACVVVFGTDASFGDLALDMDMGGGAHREHLVFLRGLTPDTDYVYRLQGSDAAGNFYASEVLHFRTAAAEAASDLGTNLATLEAGAEIVEASSEFGDAFAAQHAIDGDARSEWSSRGDGDGAFITVRLAASVRVTGFGFWTRTMGSSAQIERFEVENEHGDVFGPFDVADAAGPHVFEASGAGRDFTFRVLASSGGNTGAIEVAVYGEPD